MNRIHKNGNVQSHDQEKTKFDNKIITNSHANILETYSIFEDCEVLLPNLRFI